MKLANTALLLIDVINDFDFPGNHGIVKAAAPAAARIALLKTRLATKGVPAIYVNDNYGRWRSDFREQIERCLRPDSPGCQIASQLVPKKEDYFVLKPKHSAFFSTSLDVLLGFLGIETLILTGFASDICVLYTANDAYMRDYRLIVPPDCVAGETAAKTAAALKHMKALLKAKVMPSRYIR